MAVPKEYTWDWYKGTSSCTNPSSDYRVVTGLAVRNFIEEREDYFKKYYTNFRYEFGIEKFPINNLFKEGIANRPIKYTNIEEKTDPIQAVKFDPENLWSEPKCLINDIAQSAKQKSHSDITSKTNISELKKER